MTGKIIKGIAGFYYVHCADHQIYECKAKGIFRNKKIKPLVGDNVEITVLNTDPPEGNIDRILERKSELIRPAVANIDQALVVFAIQDPEPNLNLLDRFLVMMETSGIPVTIAFNKIDLADEAMMDRYRKIYEPAGYPVMFLSTYEDSGIHQIREFLKGKTTALAGPSGVGKSSLTNQIMPEAQMETGSISEKIKRGKHTTRHSELFAIDENSYIMDTPGFSSLYVNDYEKEDLKYFFPEFRKYEGMCKFNGCDHVHEPGCAVKAALEEDKIHKIRYQNYIEMYEEVKNKRRY